MKKSTYNKKVQDIIRKASVIPTGNAGKVIGNVIKKVSSPRRDDVKLSALEMKRIKPANRYPLNRKHLSSKQPRSDAAALVKKGNYGPNFNAKTGVTKVPGIKFNTAKLTKERKPKLKDSKYFSDGVGVGGN